MTFSRFVNTIASASLNSNTIWSAIKEARLNLLKRTGDKLDVWKEKCTQGFIVDTSSSLDEVSKILQTNLGTSLTCIYVYVMTIPDPFYILPLPESI